MKRTRDPEPDRGIGEALTRNSNEPLSTKGAADADANAGSTTV